MTITGGCRCGQLRFEIAAEAPIAARICWCRDCQYFGAGSGTANATFAVETISVSGERRTYASKADSGAVMHRSFCANCGTPVFSEAEPRPHLIIVRLGALDNPELGKPQATIWTRSAPSWACFDPELPKFEAQAT